MLLGRYEVLSKIGTGGFGHVLLARAPYATPGGSHLVAIKRLRSSRAQRRGSEESFINEARIGQYLHHPNVVKVLEFARLGRDLILVMEYINGLGVDEMLGQARLLNQLIPPDIAFEMTHQAALGLHHAHTAVSTTGEPLEIIHRDVKPSNIMVCRQGIVRVMDFGVARWSQPRMHTTTGTIKGTLRYLAPEQASGSRDIGAACDQFAMGLVLAEMLIGHAVYDAEHDHQVLLKALRVQVGGAIEEAEQCVPGMGDFLRCCLAVRPLERFASMHEFSLALRELQIPNPCNLSLAEWVHQGMLERARLTADDPDAYFRPGGDSGSNPTGVDDSDALEASRRGGAPLEGHYYLATATAEHPPPQRAMLGSTNQTASYDSSDAEKNSGRLRSVERSSARPGGATSAQGQAASGWASGFTPNPLADWDAFEDDDPPPLDSSDGSDGWRELEDVSDAAAESEPRAGGWAMVPEPLAELDCDVLRQDLISDEWLINLPAHELERRMRSKTDLSNSFEGLAPQARAAESRPSDAIRKTSDIFSKAMAEALLQGQLTGNQGFLPLEPIPEPEDALSTDAPALIPSDLPTETTYSMRRPGGDRVEMRRRPVALKFSPVPNAAGSGVENAGAPTAQPEGAIPMPGTTAELLGPAATSFRASVAGPGAAPMSPPVPTGSGRFDLESLGIPPFRSAFNDASDTYDLQISDVSDIFEVALSDDPEDDLLVSHPDALTSAPPIREGAPSPAPAPPPVPPESVTVPPESVPVPSAAPVAEPMIHEVELVLPFVRPEATSLPKDRDAFQAASLEASGGIARVHVPSDAPSVAPGVAPSVVPELDPGALPPESMQGLALPPVGAVPSEPVSAQATVRGAGPSATAGRSGRLRTVSERTSGADSGLSLPPAPSRAGLDSDVSLQATVEMDPGKKARSSEAGVSRPQVAVAAAPVQAIALQGLSLPPRPKQEVSAPPAYPELETTHMSVEELQRRGMKDVMDWLARTRPPKS